MPAMEKPAREDPRAGDDAHDSRSANDRDGNYGVARRRRQRSRDPDHARADRPPGEPA